MSARGWLALVAVALSGCWVAVDENGVRYSCQSDKDCGGDGYACFNSVCCNPSQQDCGGGVGGGSGGAGGSNSGGGTGNGCPTGYNVCRGTCVDLLQSSGNCGTCGTLCDVDQVCFGGTCAAISTVNPFLDTVNPGSVTVGSTTTVSLVGDRFATGAVLRVTAPGLTQEKPLTVTDPQHATVDLDLTGVQPASAEARVVNPGKLISNLRPVALIGVVGSTPTLTTVFPALVPVGYNGPLTVNGANLDATSQVQLSGGGLSTPQTFSTVYVSSTQLFVPALNLTALPGGTYQVAATYTGGTTNGVALTVQGAVPTITNISPTHSPRGTVITLTINGTNFGATTAARIVPGTGTAVNIPTTLVTATQVTAGPIDLTTFTPGNYGIVVQNNGSFDSNAVGFVVETNDPTLISVSPAGGRQDQTLDLTLSGARFIPGAQVSISSATLPSANLTTTYVSANSVKVMGLVLGTYPLGGYQLVVKNPGSAASASVSFTVTEGTPILATATPGTASVTATQPSTVNLTGTYFYASSVVTVSGGGLTDSPLPTTYLTPTTIKAVQDISGQSVGAYTLKVVNPGSPAPLQSNTLPFTLTP